MKKVLIIKSGSTLKSLLAEKGDFDDWVISGMGLDAGEVAVVDVRNNEALPLYDDVSGVVVSGSHDDVTDHHEWNERAARWLPGAVQKNIPVLGICFGHQLLAYALGGKAADNPKGKEFGTVETFLEPRAREDKLFEGFENPLTVHVSHNQSVVALPPGATLLASNDKDPHHAFIYGECAWGVQFHPEFDAEITKEYVRRNEKGLAAEGQDPSRLIANCRETTVGPRLLRRIAEIIKQYNDRPPKA